MITDISSILMDAKLLELEWSESRFREVLDFLSARTPDSYVQWDDEDWGRILIGDKVLAILCRRVPLLFSNSQLILLECPKDILRVAIRGFSSPSLSLRKEVLEGIFERRMSENINWSKLSVDDLWWATV